MKLGNKIKMFWDDHKIVIIPIITGIGGAIGGYLLKSNLTRRSIVPIQEDCEKTVEQVPETDEKYDWGNRMLNTIVDYEKDCEEGKNFWYDAYREKWDKVSALAKEMDDAMLLGDGEFFVIEGTNPDCNEDCPRYFVHHMIDDMPAYPPEMVTTEKG